MSISYVAPSTKLILWGKSAGRCHYCNTPIYLDDFTKAEFNSCYIAHIVADRPAGPRGHPTDSKRLKSEISNLMLLCDVHHRLIDVEDVEGHTVKRLRDMKARHEERVHIQTMTQDKGSHVLLYGAKIGLHASSLSWQEAHSAMTPERYPAERTAIEIGLQNSALGDDEKAYWASERRNLNRNFDRLVRRPISDGHITHLSVFALAPQPLLIELGRLISDLRFADIFQLQREPRTWRWVRQRNDIEFQLIAPKQKLAKVALKLSLSATVDNSRVHDVLGSDVSVWTLTIGEPHNNFLKSPKTLSAFREVARKALDKIKAKHGQDTVLHVFPAMPASAAIELGRVWQPKAGLEMVVYDQNRINGGFVEALIIQNKEFI